MRAPGPPPPPNPYAIIHLPLPITSANDLGARIRTRRKKQKLTQQQFADLAGVGRRFISEVENGKPTLEFDKVIQVARAIGLDIFAQER